MRISYAGNLNYFISFRRSEVRQSPSQPTATGKAIMCAYKLCKVEFRYWGMQSKIER